MKRVAKGFAFEEYGTRAPEAVVLLHGFLGAGTDWAPIAEAIGKYCIAFDLPGHGGTPIDAISPVNFERLGQGLAESIGLLGIERCILVGYSLGGRAALALLQQGLASCAALVLESTNPGLEDPAAAEKRIASDLKLAERICEIGTEEFLREWYAQDLFASLGARPEILNSLIENRKGQSAKNLAAALVAFSPGRQRPYWDLLANMSIPVHCVVGELDRKYLAIADEIEGRAPKARIHRVAGAGHNVHLEDFAAMVEILEKDSLTLW